MAQAKGQDEKTDYENPFAPISQFNIVRVTPTQMNPLRTLLKCRTLTMTKANTQPFCALFESLLCAFAANENKTLSQSDATAHVAAQCFTFLSDMVRCICDVADDCSETTSSPSMIQRKMTQVILEPLIKNKLCEVQHMAYECAVCLCAKLLGQIAHKQARPQIRSERKSGTHEADEDENEDEHEDEHEDEDDEETQTRQDVEMSDMTVTQSAMSMSAPPRKKRKTGRYTCEQVRTSEEPRTRRTSLQLTASIKQQAAETAKDAKKKRYRVTSVADPVTNQKKGKAYVALWQIMRLCAHLREYPDDLALRFYSFFIERRLVWSAPYDMLQDWVNWDAQQDHAGPNESTLRAPRCSLGAIAMRCDKIVLIECKSGHVLMYSMVHPPTRRGGDFWEFYKQDDLFQDDEHRRDQDPFVLDASMYPERTYEMRAHYVCLASSHCGYEPLNICTSLSTTHRNRQHAANKHGVPLRNYKRPTPSNISSHNQSHHPIEHKYAHLMSGSASDDEKKKRYVRAFCECARDALCMRLYTVGTIAPKASSSAHRPVAWPRTSVCAFCATSPSARG